MMEYYKAMRMTELYLHMSMNQSDKHKVEEKRKENKSHL